MKRRGFFGALLGAAAAPVVAKAVDAFPVEAKPVMHTVQKVAYPAGEECWFTACSYATSLNASASWDDDDGDYDNEDDET